MDFEHFLISSWPQLVLLLLVWVIFGHNFIQSIKSRPVIINLKEIKRNTIKIILSSIVVILIVGFMIRDILMSPLLLIHKILSIATWISMGLFLTLQAVIKPRITTQGLFYNGRFIKWSKIDDYDYKGDCLRLHIISSRLSYTPKNVKIYGIKISFKSDINDIKNTLQDYLGKKESPSVSL